MNKINITYFQRKPRAQNFSLEFIFNDVRERLQDRIVAKVEIAPYYSTGLINRLRIIAGAVSKQGQVNHITGDIHYISFLLDRQKTILTVADCVFMNNPSAIKRFFLKLFWLTLPAKKINYITAISTSTKNQLISLLPEFDPNKIVVIPVAVSDTFKYQPKPFNAVKPVLLHVGMAPNKNLLRLIEAIEGIDCHLIIVGKLSDIYIQKLANHSIEYSNFYDLSQSDLIKKYEECDILTFVSTYEGFGMPIVEANIVGRAVLTSNLTSMPEVAADAACLIDPFDVAAIRAGLLKIIQNEPYRNQLIINGLENAKRYDGDVIASQYYDLYRVLIQEQNQ